MCSSTAVRELPETSMWYGAISEEDAQLVRIRHAEKVEEWLDEADFCVELFKLHAKYGIDDGEVGYAAYRDYLRSNYYEKLQTYGPTPNPLDEGCDCIFCKMHAEEPPEEPQARRVRCADQPAENNQQEIGPHSGPYMRAEERSKPVVDSTANRKCVLPEATSNRQGTYVPRSPAVNQKQSETHPYSGPNATTALGSKKLEPVAADFEKPDYRATKKSAAETTPRRVCCADHAIQEGHPASGPHSGLYVTESKLNNRGNRRLGRVPAERRCDFEQPDNYQRREKKLGPVPAYSEAIPIEGRQKKSRRMVASRIPSDEEILEQPGNWLRSG